MERFVYLGLVGLCYFDMDFDRTRLSFDDTLEVTYDETPV